MPSFLNFHIPLIFALQQLKISKICMLFQPIKLHINFKVSETIFA